MGNVLKVFASLNKSLPLRNVEKASTKTNGAYDCLKASNTNISELLDYFSKSESSYIAAMSKSQIDDITQKLDMCGDEFIKTKAKNLIVSGNMDSINKAEVLLDSVNVSQKKYCTLFSAEHPHGENPKGKDRFIEMLQAKTSEEKAQIIENSYSEPRKIARIASRQGEEIPECIMQNETRFSALRDFIKMHPNDKDTATYLWKKYFVSTQDTKAQKLLNQIYDEFGVRVCFNSYADPKHLIYIKEELGMFKSALKDEAKFPELIDIRKDYFIYQVENTGAYYHGDISITIPTEELDSSTLRHELTHIVDKSVGTEKVKINKQDRKELKNAGIPDYLIDYSFTNIRERFAVASQGDMKAYSENFKKKLIEEGMPAGIFNLPRHYNNTSYLKSGFPGVKNEILIDRLSEIITNFEWFQIRNKEELKYIKKILKELPEGTKISSKDFRQLIEEKIKETKKYKPKINA